MHKPNTRLQRPEKSPPGAYPFPANTSPIIPFGSGSFHKKGRFRTALQIFFKKEPYCLRME
jgi:hypothetical protein